MGNSIWLLRPLKTRKSQKISLGLAVLLALSSASVASAQFVNFAVQPLGRITCTATFVPLPLRADNLSARVGGSLLDCVNNGVYNMNIPAVIQNMVQYIEMNVDLTLNTAVTNNVDAGGYTDAILIVNGNNSDEALTTSELAGPGAPCGPLMGTAPSQSPDIRYPCPQRAILTGPLTLTWNGVRFPVPAAANCWPSLAQCAGGLVTPTLPAPNPTGATDGGVPLCLDALDQTSSNSCFDPTTTMRFTNVRGNAAALGAGGTIIATLGVTAFASISVQTNQGAVGTIQGISTLVPRVAAGASFITQFQIINLIDDPVPYRIGIYDEAGGAMALPFSDGQGGSAGTSSELTGTLPASGGVFAETFPTGSILAGYAVVEDGIGDLAVTTSITQLVPDRDPFQAAVPLAAEPPFSRFPYVNTRPFTTVMALTNRQTEDQSVELVANDPEGVTECSANLSLGSGVHAAFAIQDRLACTANSSGVVEVRAEDDGVGPVSFVFHDFGPFTANLPAAPGDLSPERNVIPRVATGDSFETFIQATNLGDSARSYRINFYDAVGAPLAFPLADDDGQSIGQATSVSGTVPGGGVRTARTLAAGETLAGYALVETGAGDVAVNTTITQIIPDRDPFQASTPLVRPISRARLAFDNNRPFTDCDGVDQSPWRCIPHYLDRPRARRPGTLPRHPQSRRHGARRLCDPRPLGLAPPIQPESSRSRPTTGASRP